ncbi:MAG TPA: VOC family protein [Thermoanaerobaculia bacterium]|nr:VOC family protein [Thermoanaerobaculia bacterium]
MATKRRSKSASKSASKSKTAAKARASAPAKRSKGGGGSKGKGRTRAATAAKRAAGARAKTAAAPPQRTFKKRSQPETLRLKNMAVAITADDVEASSKFYVDGFGFHVKQRWESEGKLMGVELVAGSCQIGLSQDDWAKGRNRTKGVGLSIYAESSQGVEKVAARLRERGIDFEGPTTTEWGWKQVSAKDPDGFRIIVYDEPKKTGG